MTKTAQPPAPPRRSALDRATAMRLAATEYGRYLDQLRSLDPGQWRLPTDCPAWDVRAMATHNLGMAEMVASFRENLRQNRAASRRGGLFIDALTGLQVQERATMTPAADRGPLRQGRPTRRPGPDSRMPALLRSRAMPVAQPVGGIDETWTIGFLIDTILTRDTWMHRVDTARATGRPVGLTADHDGVLVADVVAEWAGRHGAPCVVRPTGPAGGQWQFGTGGPELRTRGGRVLPDPVRPCRRRRSAQRRGPVLVGARHAIGRSTTAPHRGSRRRSLRRLRHPPRGRKRPGRAAVPRNLRRQRQHPRAGPPARRRRLPHAGTRPVLAHRTGLSAQRRVRHTRVPGHARKLDWTAATTASPRRSRTCSPCPSAAAPSEESGSASAAHSATPSRHPAESTAEDPTPSCPTTAPE